jgi:replicative DNA helicase
VAFDKRDNEPRTGQVERPVPFDLGAEKAVLGSIVLDRDCIVRIADILKPEHFHSEVHADIYAVMHSLYTKQIPPDPVLIYAELQERGILEGVGGRAYIASLVNSTPTASHIEHYANIVVDCAKRRRLIEAGGRIAGLGFELSGTEAVEQAQELLRGISTSSRSEFVHVADVMNDYLDSIGTGPLPRGVPTGYFGLDQILGGLHPGDFIIVSARTGHGKTAIALGMSYNAAACGYGVAYLEMEMDRNQLGNRLLSLHSRVNSQAIRLGELSDAELGQVTSGAGLLAQLPIYIDDSPGQTISGVRDRVYRLMERSPIDLVVVDYIQIMQSVSTKRDRNRVNEVSEITVGLKLLARELNVPILGLSQLSRESERRKDHTPILADLRESGSLEQDSDIVLALYRDELYDPKSLKPDITEVHILKNRNGPALGIVPLKWNGPTVSFDNIFYLPTKRR